MVSTASGIPLTIIAGLPRRLEQEVRERLVKSYHLVKWGVRRNFEFLSSQNDGAQYIPHTIMKSLTTLAVRIHNKKKGREKRENPSHISVVYLESTREAENNLIIENFFTFAQCVKIQRGDKSWISLSTEELASSFIKAIKSMPSRAGMQGLKYAFLPLNHFTLNEGRTLFSECLDRVKNFPNECPIIKKIIPFSACARRKCGQCPQRDGAERPKDYTGLCFVSSARDGSPYGAEGIWKKLEDADSIGDKIFYSKVYLESYYRFGLPILTGTHFDVQFSGKKKIKKDTFQCPQRGGMPQRASDYVNMYPNGTVNMP